MHFPAPPLVARFLRRYKRFFADVEHHDGSTLTAHCPNTGSLLGCLVPGARVWLRDSGNPARKLRYTWQAIELGDAWVNVDTSLPNQVAAEAVAAGRVPALAGYAELQRERAYGRDSRIDFLLQDDFRPSCHVEVKSTTLVEGDCALFPDAPTERGRKHLRELTIIARQHQRAALFFFVGRADVTRFRPADAIDPEYGQLLRRAARSGVELLAYTARVEPDRLELLAPLPIELEPQPRAAAGSPRRRSSRARPVRERR